MSKWNQTRQTPLSPEEAERVAAVIAIDPGDEHVGVALWEHGGPGVEAHTATNANFAANVHADLCQGARNVAGGPRNLIVVVIEEFRLYADQASAQSWKEMSTSELIGAIKMVAWQVGNTYFMNDPSRGDLIICQQGANIKKPTRRQMKARGIPVTGGTLHARDAEEHLWYYLLRNRIVVTEPKGIPSDD